jgi:hypothetical protein
MNRSRARAVFGLAALCLLVMFGPVIEPAFLDGVGSRPTVHGLGVIANHPYSGPYEDLKLEGK